MHFSTTATAILSAVLLSSTAQAAISIVRPAASSWWVANSMNTLQWVGTDPAVFSVYVYNSNTTLLSSGSAAIVTQENAYDLSYTLVPNLNAGTGYHITLTDPQNVTNVYATSEEFEIKAEGSSYPTTTPSVTSAAASSTSASASGSSASKSASASASAAASSSTTSAGEKTLSVGLGGLLVGGLVALGF